MAIFFTSDQHYGHRNIIKYCNRPFSSVEEMNEKLIEYHNTVVSKDDTVINVGDFSMKDSVVEGILRQLNGTQILIAGNHDSCHPMHKNHEVKKQLYLDAGFKEVHQEIEFEEFLVNHFPFKAVEYDGDRFDGWRPKETEKYLIQGHVHGCWVQKDKMINVGTDVRNHRPISIDEIRAKIQHNILQEL